MSRRRTTRAPLTSAIAGKLKTLADPERAAQQQAYMKSCMPYAGIAATPLRNACKEIFLATPPADSRTGPQEVIA